MSDEATVFSRLAISLGCPSGVGPEVSLLAALRANQHAIRCALIGDSGAVLRAATLHGVDPERLAQVPEPSACFQDPDRVSILCPTQPLAAESIAFGSPSREGGRAQLEWINFATQMTVSRQADAIVTGPVSKEAIARSGAPGAEAFAGHTEHIARLVGAPEPIMIFVTDAISVALVTTHLPLAEVASAITVQAVATATFRAAEIVYMLGKSPARVVVASLNPHAGEAGMFGNEERAVIAPGIAKANESIRQARVEAVVHGPIGAETAFRKAFDGHYDAVVAMYHDQGTIPMKVRCFGKAVNVTAGMPIIRTSVDHGTAYDIAGKGTAESQSMYEAICLADKLVAARRRMRG
ncbi:MAG: 4-hydroxythreonine-4-phosphate dehydrogenase PdxA [Deltaproteobacteria bacterium]|nr:4-hydroxythreonine-4-phosphate dehydrogenase PdxA [Deltaproteobacteria bacterium]